MPMQPRPSADTSKPPKVRVFTVVTPPGCDRTASAHISGSRWSKNWLDPVSEAGDRGHLVLAEFEVEHVQVSAIRSGRTVFGITTTSRWVSQCRNHLATDLPCAAAMASRAPGGEQAVLPLGDRPHDSIWTTSAAITPGRRPAGGTGGSPPDRPQGPPRCAMIRSTSRSGWKFDTPIARDMALRG